MTYVPTIHGAAQPTVIVEPYYSGPAVAVATRGGAYSGDAGHNCKAQVVARRDAVANFREGNGPVNCFPAEAAVSVLLSDGATIVSRPISQIRPGFKVLATDNSGAAIWSEVVSFLDRKTNIIADYITFSLSGTSEKFQASANHLVLCSSSPEFASAEWMAAGRISSGMYLFRHSPSTGKLESVVVASVTEQAEVGAFAPATMQGTIIVNGIVSSCYASVKSHTVAHWSMLPLRVAYWLGLPINHDEKHEGTHWYASSLYSSVMLEGGLVREYLPFVYRALSLSS